MMTPPPTRTFAAAFSLLLLATTAGSAEMEPPRAGAARHPVLDHDRTGSVNRDRRSYLRVGSMDSSAQGVLVPVFQRLANDPRQLRFDGETGVNDLPVYVNHNQLSEPAQLRIRYLSSIAVMPEASRLIVTVNERQVATIVLDASAEYGVADIQLPPELLQFGYNAVRLSVQQRHRVDCSIEAASELWTQIDATGSGISLVSTNDNVTSVEELMGVPHGEDGAVPINVILPTGASLALIDQALRAVQALAIRADIQKPRVRFSREQPTGNGIHLYVGTRAALKELGLDHNSFGDGNLGVTGRLSTAVRVAVSGDTDEDLNTTIMRLSTDARSTPRRGTSSGLRALAFQRGAAINASNEIALSAFGISTQDFSGRVFRTSVNLVLPPDFYPADNGKAIVFLDGNYAPGLLNSNEAIVRVNGRVVGASRLTRGGGDDFKRRAIEVTLSALQPGHNTVNLEIRTARNDDKDCNPLSLIDGPRRLTVESSTSFTLPRFAQAEFLPNLGGLAAFAYPMRSAAANQLTLYLPKLDGASLAAAATLLTRVAVAAGRPLAAQTTLKAPDDTTENAVIVGALADIPENVMRRLKVPPKIIPSSWQNAVARSRSGSDRVVPTSARPTPQQVASSSFSQLYSSDIWGTVAAPVSRFLQRNIGYSAEQLSFMDGDRSSRIMPEASTLLLAQAQSPTGKTNSWLMLAGRTSEELMDDTADLVSPQTWRQLHGRIISYDPQSMQTMRFSNGDDDYVRLGNRSVSNVTLFAAGWLSNHIQYYVLLLVAVCFAFGFFSRKLLNRIGQQP